MAIELQDEATGVRHPIVKKFALGEEFIGALVDKEQRPILDENNEPKLKANGKPRQELVLTLVAMPGTTAEAGFKDDTAIPAQGDTVRFILRGKAFGSWIELTKGHKLNVGDVVTHVCDTAQAYDQNGTPSGSAITSQDEVVKLKLKGKTVGIYGTLGLRRSTPAEIQWTTAAETAYHAAKAAKAIPLDVSDAELDEAF